MTIHFQVLGAAGRDNALFVRVNNGQSVSRLLFDCGEGCIDVLPAHDILALDHLLFSHQHIDHIAGFDSLFRRIYNRLDKPIEVWGPPETKDIMRHRFGGFRWNLAAGQPGIWLVHNIEENQCDSWRFEASESFAVEHPYISQSLVGACINTDVYTVEALTMNHGTPSLAYVVREKPHLNIDQGQLIASGLRPGRWLQQLKALLPAQGQIEIEGAFYNVEMLRTDLLTETPGESIAYLSDFILDETAHKRLVPVVAGCTTLVCESQYLDIDNALAQRNNHMTATQVAELAREACVEQLILIHVSERYQQDALEVMLAEARTIFPHTYFPDHWQITADV